MFYFVVYFPTVSVTILYCANGKCMNLNLGFAGNVIDRVNGVLRKETCSITIIN
jgi:hypothetical protein